MLIKRITYYLIGLTIGSIGVYFFWQKKQATFDYGPDARTLKSIRIKERLFSDEAKRTMTKFDIDTLKISNILYNGDVDFSKGNPRKKPCAEYFITGNDSLKNISLWVKRCDSTSTIEKVIVN
ncbi:DUF4258 domain-containing protein [Polaribacter sargassicola]|uniref:DUF4258 domain-containing protein n=1 Tax=Polaribacter sargassicola TaxID=2836891 RepID=UPI001F29F60A|nr:DUF4258 domain-containing protein [Polaribacter sp. DS7-9]MCG1036573.1 DUF4258 domain-containing protein [Polaribacter sp. DS7-9]